MSSQKITQTKKKLVLDLTCKKGEKDNVDIVLRMDFKNIESIEIPMVYSCADVGKSTASAAKGIQNSNSDIGPGGYHTIKHEDHLIKEDSSSLLGSLVWFLFIFLGIAIFGF